MSVFKNESFKNNVLTYLPLGWEIRKREQMAMKK